MLTLMCRIHTSQSLRDRGEQHWTGPGNSANREMGSSMRAIRQDMPEGHSVVTMVLRVVLLFWKSSHVTMKMRPV